MSQQIFEDEIKAQEVLHQNRILSKYERQAPKTENSLLD
jgi:hypothetical protein